jgi:aspartate carbamoyltransferase
MHLLSTARYAQKGDLDQLFKTADLLQKPHISHIDPYYQARGRVMAIIKDEGSTRTRMSFEVAMKRLGGEVTLLELDNTSSISKGESLQDTIRTVSEYVDVIVLRHSRKGAVQEAAAASRVPVINAGDGDGEHPTQALLDVYTIYQKFGSLDGLNVMLVGDLKHSRTVHSLLHLLVLYKDIKVQLISPPDLMLPPHYYGFLRSHGVEPAGSSDLEKRLSLDPPDVLYVVREQKERRAYKCWQYPVVTEQVMDMLPATAMVLHPLPRCGELPVTLDIDPRCAIWRQVRNGMEIRMALLYHLFTHKSFTPSV